MCLQGFVKWARWVRPRKIILVFRLRAISLAVFTALFPTMSDSSGHFRRFMTYGSSSTENHWFPSDAYITIDRKTFDDIQRWIEDRDTIVALNDENEGTLKLNLQKANMVCSKWLSALKFPFQRIAELEARHKEFEMTINSRDEKIRVGLGRFKLNFQMTFISRILGPKRRCSKHPVFMNRTEDAVRI